MINKLKDIFGYALLSISLGVGFYQVTSKMFEKLFIIIFKLDEN